jgi:hypothetical protein
MDQSSVQADLLSFVEFATIRISEGDPAESVEELMYDWRSQRDRKGVIEDIRQGLREMEEGKGFEAATVIAEIRQRLGIRT